MPCRWAETAFGPFIGQMQCVRKFGWPGRLDSWERVWLIGSGVREEAALHLNGEFLGLHRGAQPFEFDVTRLLRVRNELVVQVDSADKEGGLTGEIALEVRCTAWLRQVRLEPGSGETRVCGQVIGNSEGPLDLYILRNGQTLHYQPMEPTIAGQEFAVLIENGSSAGVRVELTNGGVVWYVAEPEPATA